MSLWGVPMWLLFDGWFMGARRQPTPISSSLSNPAGGGCRGHQRTYVNLQLKTVYNALFDQLSFAGDAAKCPRLRKGVYEWRTLQNRKLE